MRRGLDLDLEVDLDDAQRMPLQTWHLDWTPSSCSILVRVGVHIQVQDEHDCILRL